MKLSKAVEWSKNSVNFEMISRDEGPSAESIQSPRFGCPNINLATPTYHQQQVPVWYSNKMPEGDAKDDRVPDFAVPLKSKSVCLEAVFVAEVPFRTIQAQLDKVKASPFP